MRVPFVTEVVRRGPAWPRTLGAGPVETGRFGHSKELRVKIYDGTAIRKVAVVGHGHTGKTQLVSALLFTAGVVNQLGKVDDGTSITDYDEEGSQRKFSIRPAREHAHWGKEKH